MTSEAMPYSENTPCALLMLTQARRLYSDVCRELDSADQDDNEYCLLLSNCADDLASFISGIETLRGARL